MPMGHVYGLNLAEFGSCVVHMLKCVHGRYTTFMASVSCVVHSMDWEVLESMEALNRWRRLNRRDWYRRCVGAYAHFCWNLVAAFGTAQAR